MNLEEQIDEKLRTIKIFYKFRWIAVIVLLIIGVIFGWLSYSNFNKSMNIIKGEGQTDQLFLNEKAPEGANAENWAYMKSKVYAITLFSKSPLFTLAGFQVFASLVSFAMAYLYLVFIKHEKLLFECLKEVVHERGRDIG